MPLSDFLDSLRPFQGNFWFLAGHSYIFGQTGIFSSKRSSDEITGIVLPVIYRLTVTTENLSLAKKCKCGQRATESCPGRNGLNE